MSSRKVAAIHTEIATHIERLWAETPETDTLRREVLWNAAAQERALAVEYDMDADENGEPK